MLVGSIETVSQPVASRLLTTLQRALHISEGMPVATHRNHDPKAIPFDLFGKLAERDGSARAAFGEAVMHPPAADTLDGRGRAALPTNGSLDEVTDA